MMSVRWVEEWMRGTVDAVGWPIILPSVCIAAWLLWRQRAHPLSSVEIVFLSWIALYMAVLLAPFHEMLFHYTLPLIAPAAILSARGIVAACEALEGQIRARGRLPARAIAIAAVLVCLVPAATTLLAERDISLRRTTAPNVVVGNWLSSRLPASASIAYDSLTYIPPRFTNIVATWGGTRAWLDQLNPDVVVVNRGIADTWADNPGSDEYYRCLENETCGYERVFALDDISVYQRQACSLADADVAGAFGDNDTR